MRGGHLDEAEEIYLLSGTQAYSQVRTLSEAILLADTIGSTRERKTSRIQRSSMLSSDQRAALGLTPLTLVPQERIRLSQRLSAADGKPLVFEHSQPSPRMDLNNTIDDRSPATRPGDGPPVACRRCSVKLWSPCPLCLPVATYNSGTGKIVKDTAETNEEIGCKECGANVLLPCPLCTVGLRQRINPSTGNYAARLKRKKQMARETRSGPEGSEECLSVACKGKSGRLHGSGPGGMRGGEWKSGWSWRYKGELREGATVVVRC